jgi:hypothetical protein
MDIQFSKSIDEKNKDIFVNSVLAICNLDGLKSDPSYEGGFNLPLTDDWLKKDLINKKYLQYHDSRQLRFVIDHNLNEIIGLRFKDGINYWTSYEMSTLIESIENVLSN